MSDAETTRPTRAEATQNERRRRKPNHDMLPTAYNMDVPQHIRDGNPEYNFYWAADRPGRLAQLTEQDDWDFVSDATMQHNNHKLDTSPNTRIRRNGGQGGTGQVDAYLMKKRKDFCEQDEKDRLASMLRVQEAYAQSQNFGGKDNLANDPNSYIPSEVQFSRGRLRRA